MLPPFPEGSPRASSSPSTEDAAARVGCFCPGKPTKDTAPKGFTGAGGRHPLPGIYQDSRLAERKQAVIQHKPHFFAQSGHSEILLPVNCWLELMINPACCVYPFMHKAKAVLKEHLTNKVRIFLLHHQ